ncbi:uncharacterized protein METZ01_LOCUS192219, partial [marine metagenome]
MARTTRVNAYVYPDTYRKEAEAVNEKYEFCSKKWVAFANEYLQGAAVGEDLSGISVTF